MAFATVSGSQMTDMNVTPLVDVMLVLLIIFMVTVPAITYTSQLDIAKSTTSAPSPAKVRIGIDASGVLTWNGELTTPGALQAKLDVEGARGIGPGGVLDPKAQAVIEIAANPETEYEAVAQVLARVKNANLVKVSLVD